MHRSIASFVGQSLVGVLVVVLMAFVVIPMLGLGGVLTLGLISITVWVALRSVNRMIRFQPGPTTLPRRPEPKRPLTVEERARFDEVVKNFDTEPPSRRA